MTPFDRACRKLCCPAGCTAKKFGEDAINCSANGEYIKATLKDVLTAIREPSEAMLEAWAEARPEDAIYDDPRCARADWQAMIDALIAEGTGK